MLLTQSSVEFPERNINDWYTLLDHELGRGSFGLVQEALDDREILLRLKWEVPPEEEMHGYYAEDVYKLRDDEPEKKVILASETWLDLAVYLAQFDYASIADAVFPFFTPPLEGKEDLPESRLELILETVKFWSRVYKNTRLTEEEILEVIHPVENPEKLRPSVVVKIMGHGIVNDKDQERLLASAKTEVYALGRVASKSPILMAPRGAAGAVSNIVPPVGCHTLFDTDLIVCLLDYFYTPGPTRMRDVYYIVLSLTNGPNLLDLIIKLNQAKGRHTPLPGEFLWYMAWSMAHALKHIHQNHIIHNDVKPENILYDRATGGLSLIDFGLSCHLDLGKQVPDQWDSCDAVGGTPTYAAPEQVRYGKRFPTSDVWALGVTLWEAATGENYYIPGDTLEELLREILRGFKPDLREIDFDNIVEGNHLKILLDRMLQRDSQLRIAPERILKFIFDTFQPGDPQTDENEARLKLFLHDKAVSALERLEKENAANVDFSLLETWAPAVMTSMQFDTPTTPSRSGRRSGPTGPDDEQDFSFLTPVTKKRKE